MTKALDAHKDALLRGGLEALKAALMAEKEALDAAMEDAEPELPDVQSPEDAAAQAAAVAKRSGEELVRGFGRRRSRFRKIEPTVKSGGEGNREGV